MLKYKNKTILFLLAIFIILLLIPSTFALDLNDSDIGDSIAGDENSIYVSTAGSDDGNGSQSNPFNSISSAVNAFDSSKNSNVYIENGNYDITSQITINKDITIVGESSDGVILNGNGQSAILKITSKSNVVLNSLTFANGYDQSASQYSGSAVFVDSAVNDLLIDNCIFKDNKNGTFAAQSYFASGTITIQNSQFTGNEKSHRSWDYGSAVSVGGKYNINVINTTFEDNTPAPINLYNNVALAVFDNCKFLDNVAGEGNSAIRIYSYESGDVTIKNSEFRGNVAGENFYLIYFHSDKATNLYLGNNTIEGNTPNTIYTSDKVNVIYSDSNARLLAEDLKMYEGQNKSFEVKFIDADSNPIAGKEIVLTLTNYYNHIFTFNATTNASGIASFNLKDQKFAKYNAVSQFAGDSEFDACNITNTIAISSDYDYNMVLDPDYVKMTEGDSFNVTGYITDNYGEPDNILNGVTYEIRWLNHDGLISVLNGNIYKINGSKFIFDLSRCHLATQNELYYVNFSASYNYDWQIDVAGSLPVDLSKDMPPVDPNIEVIWVSTDGSDETGDGSFDNPLKTVQLGLYVNMMLGGSKTIHIKEGTYDVSIYTLNDKVTLVGEGSKTVLRQVNGRLGMFSIENQNTVSFVNLTFTNGYATPVPASLITVTEQSTVYIDGCTFHDNVALRGGAIAIDASNAFITNSYFYNNTARLQASHGGAIYIIEGVLTIENTTFEDNEATLGGAIFSAYDADTHIIDCTFINNTAVATTLTYGGGGAIYSQAYSGTLIENSTFIGNYAEVDGGAIYVSNGQTDVIGCYFYDNDVKFGTEKGSTIHAFALDGPIYLNVSYSILFTENDYLDMIYVEDVDDDNESTFAFDYNYWGGQQKGFVSTNKAVTYWVILDASKDTNPVNKGDVVKITTEFKGIDVNGTVYDLEESVHDLAIMLSPYIGEVNPTTIVLSDNIAEFEYYANEYGSEYINFTTDYARHYVYSFNVIDSSKVDANPNITVDAGKTTTIDVQVPTDIENNITITVAGEDYSIKAIDGHAIKTLTDMTPGNYSVTVTYAGDDKYKGFVNTTSFTIDKYLSEVSISIDDIDFGDLLIVNVNVTKGATGNVVVTIDNKNYTIELNDSEGTRSISNIDVGTYTAYAKYVGDANYDESTSSTTFTVNAIVPIITIYVSTKGSDITGNGSEDNPYATLSYALDRNHRLGGDKTIIVSGGSYVLNRYSIIDNVTILADGDVTVYSNESTNHIYIGGDVDVYLQGITFADGNGYTAGSIDMGSSSDNSLKKLTIVNCTFIDNKGPVGAIVSYANTYIIQSNFINNTATGNSGSVQGIVNVRDNAVDISYSIFAGNRLASDLIVYSTVSGTANNNFWGNNSKPTDKTVSSKLTKDSWIVIDASVNDSDIVLRHDFTVDLKFKSTADGKTLSNLNVCMGDVDASLKADLGILSPGTVTMHKNTASSKYNVYTLGNEVIDVYVANEKVTNITFTVNIPEEDKIYVDVDGDDANNGSSMYPLKSIEAAIMKNKLMGGDKVIIIRNGNFTAGDLTIDDKVSIIGSENSNVKLNSLKINAETSISGLTLTDGSITSSSDLEIYNSKLVNSKLTSTGDNLVILNSLVSAQGIVSSSNTLIDNTTFSDISAKALEISENANITNSRFENNALAIDITNGEVTVSNNEFNANKDVISVKSDDEITIDSNKFSDNSGISIDANSDVLITNNLFGNGTIRVNAKADVKNNRDVKYELINGTISNTVITYFNGATIKVYGDVITLNATVTDDMGNPISGGVLEFIVDEAKVGEADIIDGVAKYDCSLSSGEYTISGSSKDLPDSKINSALLRVNVDNFWFIGDVGYETLAEAVEAAQNGDVIRGVPGTYLINEIIVGHRPRLGEEWTTIKNITITSLDERPVTLEALYTRLFFIDMGSNLTLKNLILANSHNDGDVGFGGAVDVYLEGQLNVDNCSFINNSADQGGAIYALGGVNIKNSKFINNTAGLVGGAIFKDFYGDLVIENTSFVNSFASSFGGAVYLLGNDDTDNYIVNCVFDSNTGFRGGALYAGGANLTVIGSNFTSNNALRVHTDYEDEDANGGAFYNYYANVFFYDSNFINNHAQDCGGAMELDNTITSTGSYDDPTITIYVTEIDNCKFINNTADDGGAIYMGYAGRPFVFISDSLFESNTANYDSAAIANVIGYLELVNSTFRDNTAGKDTLIYVYGTDDIYNEYDAYLFVDNCTFERNNVNLDIEYTNMYSFGEIANSTFIGEQTTILNRGFLNVTSTVVKDSRNASKYVINNFGQLGLENNTFDNPLYSDVYIITPTYLVVLENETHNVAIGSEYTLTALVYDDNGNLIEGADIVFIIDGAEINATLINHVYSADYTVTEGTHVVDANYSNSGFENMTIKTAVIKASKAADMNVTVNDIREGEDAVVEVSIAEDATGTITVSVNNRTYSAEIKDGKASVTIPDLTVGEYDIKVTYSGDDKYPENTVNANITVIDRHQNATMDITAENITEGENLTVDVKLPSNATGNVTVSVDGKNYTAELVNGTATITVPELGVGNHTVEVSYSGDDNYAPASRTISVDVAKDTSDKISAPDVVKYYNGSERFAVTVCDYEGNPIANKTVLITINGVSYTRSTNANGTTSIALGLNAGIYNVTTVVDNRTVNSVVTIISTINGTDLTKVFRNATQYYATFRDSEGNYLPDGTMVRFNINGVFYDRYVRGNEGLAKLNINLEQGQYIITAINLNNGEMHSNVITVIPRIIENNDLTKYYRNASQYTVKLIGDDGKAVGAGVEVTFNINGVFYTRTTNASGIAKLNINLEAGNYIITAEYAGCRVSNNIEVLHKLSASDITMSYRDGTRFEAKLVDDLGNPYPSQGITFNINGVFYIRYTDADGIARLNINLMSGEYIITSSFNGENIANKITIH